MRADRFRANDEDAGDLGLALALRRRGLAANVKKHGGDNLLEGGNVQIHDTA